MGGGEVAALPNFEEVRQRIGGGGRRLRAAEGRGRKEAQAAAARLGLQSS